MNFLRKILLNKFFLIALLLFIAFTLTGQHALAAADTCELASDGQPHINADVNQPACVMVNTGTTQSGGTGFAIPTLSVILTFAIRAFFIIGGLAALIFLLLGALAWITSGGDKENVSKAQQKITNAIIGVILIAVVLAVIVTLEQVVFGGKICLGLSCPITIPSLIK